VLAGISLDPLYRVMGWLLALFYAVPPHSLGISIILLTIVVMAVQFPLIAKQTRSMIQMQRVQPEIKKIQQMYKDDRQKQNEELLKFYQENKINPLAGCLPLIITLPIGIAVYRLFRLGVQKHIPTGSGPLGRLYRNICTIHGTYYANEKDCTHQLSTYGKGKTPPTFRFLGMNLNWSARQVQTELAGHYLQWIPYFAIIVLVMLSGWYQVRQTQARQLQQGSAAPNAQMQTVTRLMPIIFGFITYGLNAATTLYFLVSNVWRIGQQHFVLNKMYEEAAGDSNKPKGSGTAAPKAQLTNDNGEGDPPAQPARSTPSPNQRRGKKKKRRR
jgi:YidC/Oxa1 family membrane protein insertase